ncbi:terminase small subunit [Anaerotignum sp.]
MAERKLTEKQQTFCRLCAMGVKPIEAAKKAGYRNYFGSTGELLRNERIQQEIKRQKETAVTGNSAAEKPEEETPAEKEEILSFLTEVMRDNEEADLKTRMKAAELLGKRESLFEKGKGSDEKCRVVIVDDIP